MVIFLLIFVSTNLYSRLIYNSIEDFIPVSLTSLIEGHWCIFILLLFGIGFNLSNVYAILCVPPTYGYISIFHTWV